MEVFYSTRIRAYAGQSNWFNVTVIDAVANQAVYSHTVDNLQPDTEYAFRILLTMRDVIDDGMTLGPPALATEFRRKSPPPPPPWAPAEIFPEGGKTTDTLKS